jgi:hypothetical protein
MDLYFSSSRTAGEGFGFDYSKRYTGIVRLERYLVRKAPRIRGAVGQLRSGHRDLPGEISKGTALWVKRIYQNQRSVIKIVPSIDIDSSSNGLLTSFQISNSASIAELLEFRGDIKGALISKDTSCNKLVLVLKLNFELVFAEYHV